MAKEATNLLLKFSSKLFQATAEQEEFVSAILHPQPYHPTILWCRSKPENIPFHLEQPLLWQPKFVDRLALSERPGQHELHHQGYYYCLDFSSVFAASVLLAIPQSTPIALDMCASPGGKSVFAQVALQPGMLMCNETIGKRLGALVSNLKRCISNRTTTHVRVFNLDSSILAEHLANAIDVVFVDAPCTGQSLLAKGEKNPGCFHPVNINKNANRQKRIMANSAQIVAPGGYLAYMTCAYSIEENEGVVDWLLDRFPQFEAIDVPHLETFRSHLSDRPCYRMFPQQGLGAGAFTALFRNVRSGEKSVVDEDVVGKLCRVEI